MFLTLSCFRIIFATYTTFYYDEMAGASETPLSWADLDEIDRAESTQDESMSGKDADVEDIGVITVAGGLAVTVSEVGKL